MLHPSNSYLSKMNSKHFVLAALCTAAVSFSACSDDDEPGNLPQPQPTPPSGEVVLQGDTVSGVWAKHSVIKVKGHHLVVPEGKSLTIEAGVTVVFDAEGVGTSHTPIEMIVDGALYSQGTAEQPVRFTVSEDQRTEANAFAGLWGGIVATEKCPEMLFDHTIIEYTGGAVSQDSPSALKGIYTPGEDYLPQITTNNINGRYVVTHSTLRNGISDAIYMMGGQAIIQHNTFAGNGETGGEAVNIKAGCKVDAAFNLMYSPNTNGLKLSSSGQNDETGRHQALVRAYNNTIVNAGWRRDGVKGGSIYLEKNALASVFNNLMVNCKFKAMTPKWGNAAIDAGCSTDCVVDYNFYTAGNVTSNLPQDVEEGTTNPFLSLTQKNKNIFAEFVDVHSTVAAKAGDEATNPLFVNYDINAISLTSFSINPAWDFHVAANSPVLSGAYTGTDARMQPFFGTTGITVNGQAYRTDLPAARFGAFGNK